MGMEIERKYTLKELPADLESYTCHIIEQAYLNTSPVVRVRRQDDTYYMTYKGGGMMAREEYNLPLDEASYLHLREKADGNIISKKRYVIPFNAKFAPDFIPDADTKLVIELDVFYKPFDSLIMAEVEFTSIEMANAFIPPEWFDKDVTQDPRYHNSNMSKAIIK